MKSGKTLIHIGMHKCASTTLQRAFFSNIPEINYIGSTSKNEAFKSFVRRVTRWENMYYEQQKKTIIEGLKRDINPELPILVSSEGISGSLTQFSYVIDRERVARRLKEIFPDAHILVVIRNQFAFFQSAYPQLLMFDLMRHEDISFTDWIDYQLNLHREGRESMFHYADYEMLINIYNSLFSKVHVLIFEEMVKNMEKSIRDDICPLIGIIGEKSLKYYNNQQNNKRHSPLDLKKKTYNIWMKKFKLEKNSIPEKVVRAFGEKALTASTIFKRSKNRIDVEYTDEQKKKIDEIFAGINSSVSNLIGKDLRDWGYPVK